MGLQIPGSLVGITNPDQRKKFIHRIHYKSRPAKDYKSLALWSGLQIPTSGKKSYSLHTQQIPTAKDEDELLRKKRIIGYWS